MSSVITTEDDVTYYCACSWIGGDPDIGRNRRARGGRRVTEPTCPACWKIDRKRVPVKAAPPCRLSMGCVCAGHLRGLPASSPCDAREIARCPTCGKSDQLCITETYVAMHPFNAAESTAENALGATCPSEHFDDGAEDYGMCCRNCGHGGTLTEFGADLKDWT